MNQQQKTQMKLTKLHQNSKVHIQHQTEEDHATDIDLNQDHDHTVEKDVINVAVITI